MRSTDVLKNYLDSYTGIAFERTKRFTNPSFFESSHHEIREILFVKYYSVRGPSPKFIRMAIIFRNQDHVVGKACRFNNGTANSRQRKATSSNAISRTAENAKRGRSLCGNGILSSSADGPLISATAMFPKCFVSCCFEPYSPSPRVYRDCHCLFKQFAVINPERFLRKL